VWDGIHRFQFTIQLLLPHRVRRVAEPVVELAAPAVTVMAAPP